MKSWKTLSSKYIMQRPWMTARKDTVELPDGRVNPEYWVLEYPDWVNIIAVTEEGQLVMERQYRHGIDQTHYEIPAGVIEAGETPLEAARRELLEETGYEGGEWVSLMTSAPNSSVCSNFCHSFLARGVKPTGRRHLDEFEVIDVMLMNKDKLLLLLEKGEIVQSMMLAPLYKALYEKLI